MAVGDLRIDNREDLRNALKEEDRPLSSDIAIVAAGYEKWGEDVARQLVGDFAFVIWDSRLKRVYAARDPFGVRSLVYRVSGERLIFATDAAQFLNLEDADRAPDPQIVVDHLVWSYAHYGPTFFRGVSSVRPGHFLTADRGGMREVRYFEPPETFIHYREVEEYHQHFYSLFRRAVEDRLDSAYPVVAHLSGGLDSSSVVCMADRIYREGESQRPRLVTASALFPGQPCDEKPFIDSVARAVRFPSRCWNGNDPSGREFTHPALGIPGSSISLNGGSVGDVEIALEEGSRVLLSGEGGDFVTGEMGCSTTFLLGSKWFQLIGQVAAGHSPNEREGSPRTGQERSS